MEDIKLIERYVKTFPAYFNSVINYVVTIPFIYLNFEGEECRDRVENLDINRRSCHIKMTDAINKLNTLAVFYGAKPIFDIEGRLDSNSIEDRELAKRIVYSFCSNVFKEEMNVKKNNERIISEAELESDLHQMAELRQTFKTNFSLDDSSEL